MTEHTYKPAEQCIYNVSPKDRIAAYKIMHQHCLEKMNDCVKANDQVKFWGLASVGYRILKAQLRVEL